MISVTVIKFVTVFMYLLSVKAYSKYQYSVSRI